MHALTNPDEHGNCHLLDITKCNGDLLTLAVFTIHEDDLAGLVTMLVESLTDEQRDDLRGLL